MELKFKSAERLSHAYLISAQSAERAFETARTLAAAAVCLRGHDVPCGECRACRKVFSGIHPDVTVVSRPLDGEGRKKREIPVELIRAVKADACILPNEAERKVYIINEADTMNPSAQNAALKLLEEPPRGVILLLCAVNPSCLPETVRSRCAEIRCGGETEAADEEMHKLAKTFLRTAASGDRAKLFAFCAKNEGMSVKEAGEFLDCVYGLTADMLCLRADPHGMAHRDIAALNSLAKHCSEHLRVNTGVKHIFGLLAVDAIAGGGNRG